MNKTSVVIGAGIAGLASAIRLATKGYKTIILEKNNYLGGKISEHRIDGFRWDMGPSLFTLPEILENLFTFSGANLSDYSTYEKLDLVTKYFYPDGVIINGYGNPTEFANEIDVKTKDKKEAVLKYLKNSETKYNLTKKVFLESSLNDVSTYISKEALYAYVQAYKLDAFKTLHQYNTLNFIDTKTIQLFDRFATYNGSSPFETPATLSIIPHLEHNLGAYYPKGGMYAIIKALEKRCLELKVEIMLESKVEKLSGNKVIYNGDKEISFDFLINNTDITHKNSILGPLAKNYELSTSAIIFYWAVDEEIPILELHNILFSANYLKEFHQLNYERRLPDDPTVYLYASNKINEKDAPQGKTNLFAMINYPSNESFDAEDIDKARAIIINKILSTLNIHIGNKILYEHISHPRDLETRTGANRGALYGFASNDKFSAFRRPSNYSKSNNVYNAGGTVHPGGGIPLCLLSADIATRKIPNNQ